MTRAELPEPIAEIGRQLRRRRLPLGIDDYDALRRALAAGFGWSSYEELCRLCVALWAKSPEEAEIVRAVVSRGGLATWNVSQTAGEAMDQPSANVADVPAQRAADDSGEHVTQAEPVRGLGVVPPSIGAVDRTLVMVPQYPLTEREIAQAWRRLRRRLRSGPAVELDVAATVEQHSRHGIATPPVLVPRRRNTAKLLLLIDRFGSMTPFHGYVDHVVRAIRNAGRIDDAREAYFHDLPGSIDRTVLEQVKDPFRPDLDAVLSLIEPMRDGSVYQDPQLTVPCPLTAVLDHLAMGTPTLIISDAGAARRRYDATRLLDTVALLKALHAKAGTVMWVNPVQPENWLRTTADQVRRYIPMYPLTREGLDRAIDGLRGRPVPVERVL
jgi:uncharacterized protein with von Willebrand factor type A (vWA) domain